MRIPLNISLYQRLPALYSHRKTAQSEANCLISAVMTKSSSLAVPVLAEKSFLPTLVVGSGLPVIVQVRDLRQGLGSSEQD